MTLLAKRVAGVDVSMTVFNVRNFDHRAGVEQCIIAKVRTVNVRHAVTLYNAASEERSKKRARNEDAGRPSEITPPKASGSKEDCPAVSSPSDAALPGDALDMFDLGFESLKGPALVKPAASKSPVSSTVVHVDPNERC